MIRLTRTKTVAVPFLAAASLLLLPAAPAQNSNARKDQTPSAATSQAPAQAKPEADAADRSRSYFHDGMAAIYEDEAVASGRPEFIAHSIEEYKAALNADPTSPSLNNALADLYLRVGRVKEAESTARTLLKSSPDDLDAHKLLGRIFLRQLSEAQNAVSSSSPSGNVLDEAIAEFQKILSLQPKDVEDHMILGQLYAVRHESAKAEEQYKLARSIEPDSEDAILNLARLYAENNDVAKAAKVIEDVPQQDRTAKMESALGTAYDQLKQPKEAIAAYQRALDLDPADVRSINALAQALLNDNQLDAALKQYKSLSEADPDDIGSLIHISEIQRRQGKYEDALTTIRTAVKKDPDSLEAGYNEGLLLDVLGRFDEAVQVYQHMVDLTSHANGAYTSEEKNNRGIFLDRLGALYHEENKTDQAIETYQKLIDLGGDQALRGYQGEVDTYRDAKMFDKAIEVARKAAATDPKNTDLKLMLAGEMADSNNPDDGITMAKSLLTNTDKDRVVWLSLAQTYTRLRRWKDADDALNKAASLTTKQDDKVYLLFLRGALAERQKHYDTAEQFFHQVLDIDPNNAMTLNYMGYMFADKGTRLPEAIKLIRKAVELDPMNGAYLDSLGWAYFKMGQYELAEENLRQAADRDQTDPTVHDHLGDLYEKTGRIRLAAAQWEMSIAEFAKSAPADVEPTEVAKVQHKLETARVKLAKEDSLTTPNKPE
jgi:tetratricopeptide (TPR) repeat protein